jgi:hypothetical protein
MASYYVATGCVTKNDSCLRKAGGRKSDAEKLARLVRRTSKVATRVLLRCDHRYPGEQQDGSDSERHMGLHYRRVATFPFVGH